MAVNFSIQGIVIATKCLIISSILYYRDTKWRITKEKIENNSWESTSISDRYWPNYTWMKITTMYLSSIACSWIMILLSHKTDSRLYIGLFGTFWLLFLIIDVSATASNSSNYLMIAYDKMKRTNPIGYALNYILIFIYIGLHTIALLNKPLINYKEFMALSIGLYLFIELILNIQYYRAVLSYIFSSVQISAGRKGYGEVFVECYMFYMCWMLHIKNGCFI